MPCTWTPPRCHGDGSRSPSRLTMCARIYEACADAGLAFSPVHPSGRDDLGEITARAEEAFGLGAVIHIDTRSLVSWGGNRPRATIAADLDALKLTASEVDVMLDLGYLAEPVDDLSLRWLLEELLPDFGWRSVIIAATSVPKSVAGEVDKGDLGSIPRHEGQVVAWATKLSGLPVRFGDFGVQNPQPPKPGGSPNMIPSIRYTSDNATFVARADLPVKGRSREAKQADYQRLADRLVNHSAFRPDCCWGDHYLVAVANGSIRSASQERMRAIATCHHVTAIGTLLAGPRPLAPQFRARRRAAWCLHPGTAASLSAVAKSG